MILQLDWPQDVVAELTGEAREKGLSLDDYLLRTVLETRAANAISPTGEAAKR